MKEVQVIMFEAEDGQKFDDADTCLLYEFETRLRQWCDDSGVGSIDGKVLFHTILEGRKTLWNTVFFPYFNNGGQ